jgi:hypothetical protein
MNVFPYSGIYWNTYLGKIASMNGGSRMVMVEGWDL